MRVISLKALKAFWPRHPDAQGPLRTWFRIAKAARWANFLAVRRTYSAVDAARVGSGNTVTIFGVGGNKYRLITAIHHNTGCLYVLMVLTHAEYSRDKWKDQL